MLVLKQWEFTKISIGEKLEREVDHDWRVI